MIRLDDGRLGHEKRWVIKGLSSQVLVIIVCTSTEVSACEASCIGQRCQTVRVSMDQSIVRLIILMLLLQQTAAPVMTVVATFGRFLLLEGTLDAFATELAQI